MTLRKSLSGDCITPASDNASAQSHSNARWCNPTLKYETEQSTVKLGNIKRVVLHRQKRVPQSQQETKDRSTRDKLKS
eukprot:232928-Amphidinium_carterae.1